MSTLNLPVVKGEDEWNRTCRMIFTVGLIIVGMFIIINKYAEYYNNCDFIPRVETFADEIYMPANSLPVKYQSDVIMAKSISIYNLNKKIIPVEQIILIDVYRRAHYIPRASSILSHLNKEGSSITFILPAPMTLLEIIIDVGEDYPTQNNIITSHVEVRDVDDKVIWNNINPLNGGVRYNYLSMKKAEIIEPAAKLTNKNMGLYNEINEHDLDDTLQTNTWN